MNMRMKPISAARQKDERTLSMLAMKQRGDEWKDIAKGFGLSNYTAAQRACRNVRDADIAESGEDEATVRAGYWA